ncbi:MAG: hypothetical protein IPJ94_31365 [Chloroflexi bacterium]|nr:hypothetical protein [Chloroflexota bacterium]
MWLKRLWLWRYGKGKRPLGWRTMAVVTESQTTIQRSTYSLAGQAIAVRVAGSPLATNNGLFYLYSDHLGSASALVTGGGQKGERDPLPALWRLLQRRPQHLTDRGFTGQKENMELGLLYYNARFYAPAWAASRAPTR